MALSRVPTRYDPVRLAHTERTPASNSTVVSADASDDSHTLNTLSEDPDKIWRVGEGTNTHDVGGVPRHSEMDDASTPSSTTSTGDGTLPSRSNQRCHARTCPLGAVNNAVTGPLCA